MKKIDFQNFPLIGDFKKTKTVVTDVREDFANLVYTKVPGIAALELSRKIYNSEGETEYSDEEMELISKVVVQLTTPAFFDSFSNIMSKNN